MILLALPGLGLPSFSQTTNSYTSNGSYLWTCPAGVTSVSVQCWGAGGAGGGATAGSGNGGAGGAGGAYASTNSISVTPGNTYTVNVGKGGTGVKGNGASGGDSWFGSTSTILAKGGAGGQANNSGNPGIGSTTGCIGTIVYKGGSGTSGSTAAGSAGGGAGSTGNGGNGQTSSPWSGGTGTTIGGGNGGNYVSVGNGNPGSGAGGGGSGARTSNSTQYSGGSGADGRVDITYVITLSVSGTSTMTCVGGSTGTITATATGGTSPYTYSLNGGSYQSSNLFTGLAAGTYTLSVKDNNGNTGSVNITVSPCGTSSDNQNLTGTNSWIGHMYDGTNFSNYIGHFTEAETFNEGFGGSYTCFDVTSNSSTSSIYTETFSVKFRMNSTRQGLYVVNLGSDDGSRLTVDGSLIYNNWSDQSFSTKSNVLISLTGSSTMLYEYYENGGSNQVIFQNLTLVLANNLTTNTTQSVVIGNSGSAISGDAYGTLPSGISLSGTGYQWSYSTTPGGAQTNISGATGATFTPSTSTAPFNVAGTYYIYRNASLTSTNNVSPNPYTATNISNAAVITVTSSPSVSGVATQTCVGGSTGTITATATGGTSPYTYSLNGGSYQSSNLFTGLAAGTYTLSVKDNNGNTGSVNITVSPCGTSSDNQNLTGTNSWIGHMYDGTNFSNYIGHFTEAETFNEGFGGSYTCFDVTSNSSTSSIYTETFSVKFRMNSTRQGLYVVNLGSDDGSRLTVDGSLIYNNWSDQSFSTKSNVLISLTGSSTLLYEYYENGGSNQVIFQNISLLLANTLSTNTAQNICVGSTGSPISGDVYGSLPSGISLSGTGYQWSYSTTPGGAQTNISGATGATFTPSASVAPFNTPGTYYIYRNASLISTNNVSPNPYTATNTSNAATIVVNSTPSINGTTPGSNCGTGTVTLGASASAGTIKWYANATGGSSLGTGTGYTTPSISSTTTYYVDATANGCTTGSRTSVVATINTIPIITGTTPNSRCGTGTVTLGASASAGTIKWYANATGGSSLGTGTGYTTPSISSTTTYYVDATANGCTTGSRTSVAATINSVPTISGTLSVCAGSTTQLSGSGTPAASNPWTSSNTSTATVDNTGLVTGVSSGSVTITYTNNSGCSTTASVTVNGLPPISQVPTSNLTAYYKFNGNANDANDNDNGTLQGSPTSTTDRFGNSVAAYNFNGSSQYVSTANSYNNPSDFTISIWFKTGTSTGGKLIGFGNAQTGQSTNYDRHLYMSNSGQIYFGVYPGAVKVIYSPNSYNDNQWHLATATLSSTAGMCLYIDGALVASDPSTTTAQNYTGYWRIGYDNVNGWTSNPTSYYFSGILDDALIYSTALTSTQVAAVYSSPDGAGNNGPVCSGSTLTLAATTVSGASYAWYGPNSFSSTSQNPILTYSTAYAGTYKLVVTSSVGCTATAYTNVLSSTTAGQWVGGFSNNWNNANNWCNGIVPDITTNVAIPSSSTFLPIVSDNQYSANLVINTGATLNVNSGGTLQIAGSITNNGIFVDTSGTIRMSGTSAQTIPANTFYNNSVYNLVIDNTSTSGVTLGGPLDIYNSLTYTGTGMSLNTNDNLTIKSNATGTGWVGDMTGNSINGKVTVERYLEPKKGWRLLSVPTNTSQTISSAWQEGCGSNSNCVTGFGTQITGSAGVSGGFDEMTSSPSMKTYNSASGAYVGVPTTNSTPIGTNSGYMIFVRGDRSVTSVFAAANPTVLRSKGPLYVGPQSPINVAASKFAVIGNPYASALDMRNITRSGMKDFFYVWDPMLSGANGYGGFQTFSNDGSGNYVVTPGGGSYPANGSISNYIQSGQAFFMQAQSSGGSVTMTESAKTSGSSIVNAPQGLPSPTLTVNLYGIDSKGTNYMADGFMVNYGSQYNNAVDELDAIKSNNSAENLADKRDHSLLIVERRQMIEKTDTIFINMAGVSKQNYYFLINATSLSQPGLSAYLLDNFTGVRTPLQVDGSTTLNFTITSAAASYASNRFEIIFDNSTGTLPVTFTNVQAISNGSTVKVLWDVQNETNIKSYEVEHSVDGINFTAIATAQPIANNGGSANYQAIDSNAAAGINYYRVISVDIDGKIDYSRIVKAYTGEATRASISVFPNPIQNNAIYIHLLNKAAGVYKIRLFNSSGKLLISQSITNPGGNFDKGVKVPSYMATGVYQLEVIDPKGSADFIKIIK